MVDKRVIAGIVAFSLLVGAAGYKLFRPAEKGITATGTIEVTRADITAKVGGYMTGLTLQQGDTVSAGQIIAHISRKDLDAQLLRDRLALDKAESQLRDLEQGTREQERQAQAANVTANRSVLEKAQTDYSRYQRLYQEGGISTQQLDAARSAMEVAYNNTVAAEQQLSLLEEGNRPEVIEAQRLEVERSRAVVAASQVLAEDTIVPSPLDGLVLTKNFENNEYINPGIPIATVGDMNDCWVKIYVPSPQIGLLQVGQAADVKVDSYPDRIFSGVIKEISQTAEFTPRQSITQRERANQVFAVKVKIDNGAGLLKPGMPADVVLQ
ncbi:MAG: efflux RND transporter periplasmic adaptor subunit [Veillonellales bacterium]